jgi:Cd2+/Zn2+-exporting ATPase
MTGLIKRYREFLFSRETITTMANGILLLAGLILTVSGERDIGRWVYLASSVVGGLPLVLGAIKGVVIKRDITAGVMGSIAVIAAVIIGEYSAAALVVFMMALGEWLEELTVKRAHNALDNLASLLPSVVTLRKNGREVVVPLEKVVPQDIVLVRSGERVPVDGKIISGNGTIDEASITGESLPVEKNEGDKVYAGTINVAGAVQVEAVRVGDRTTLSQIVRLVKTAQESKAPVERVADKYAKYLIPATLLIALIVFLLSHDVTRSITVLVVVCPCALVLATPTAIMASIANAARKGILVKSGSGMERIGKIKAIAFDKTGTLTYGKLVVVDTVPFFGFDSKRLLCLAAATERFSEHPIARAIVLAAEEKMLEIGEADDFQAMPGFGVTARLGDQDLLAGNRGLLKKKNISISAEAEDAIAAMSAEGKTVILLAVNETLAGAISLSDQVRLDAKSTISEIRRKGIGKAVLITGDNQSVASRIAHELDLDSFNAEVLPNQKLELIQNLQTGGTTVAFVGDGVNDAPALATADIGIAMGVAGTDVAMETAEIGLMKDELYRLPFLIALSRKTLKIIRQNVVFSMAINILAVLLGSFGVIGMVVGAAIHEVSSLPVLINSARLVGWRYASGTAKHRITVLQ